MEPLSNPQHEVFTQHVAAGYSLTEAAKRAKFPESSAHNTGSRLMKQADIRQRVEELHNSKDATRADAEAWVISELRETHRLAREAKQHSVCVQALLAIAKIQGLLNDGENTKERSSDALREPVRALREDFAALPLAERQKFLLEAPAEVRELLDVTQRNFVP